MVNHIGNKKTEILQFGKLQTQDWIFGPKEDVGSSTYYGLSSSGQSTGPYDAKWTYSRGVLYEPCRVVTDLIGTDQIRSKNHFFGDLDLILDQILST